MNEKQVIINENEAGEVDSKPVYIAPKRVSLAAEISSVTSWLVLVFFLGNFIVQVIFLRSQLTSGNMALATLLKEPSFLSYIFTNIIIPLLTGLGIFILLRAAAAGLNMLLEMDINTSSTES
jgi:hypothetical protein